MPRWKWAVILAGTILWLLALYAIWQDMGLEDLREYLPFLSVN